jgi:hypothetical protein
MSFGLDSEREMFVVKGKLATLTAGNTGEISVRD